ncbi:MAG: HD-GYP domain-containing protein [Lachnospiraceae bacterium]|nr:HD-GYP domain-containing protein [Lachnospiraceae bacterium]
MSLVSVEDLKAGMILSDDVYIFNDKLLMPKGTELTDYLISKLGFYAIKRIKVKDFSPEDLSAEEETQESYATRLKRTAEFKAFKEEFFKNVYLFKTDFLEIANDNVKIEPEIFINKVSSILDTCGGVSVFDMLHCMRDYDDTTFVHALNTALICNVFGNWLNMDETDLQALTLAGLLHDIGKIRVPDSIVKKTGALTETEKTLMQTHTVYGYEILKNQDIDERIKLAALMHHERCDGTGYPKSLADTQIADFAKIVGIASEYDSLTAARSYREAICPFDVIRTFELEGLQKYDARYILIFLEHITNSLINNTVVLNDGQQAEVIMINRQFLSRPVVKIGNEFIDLSKNKKLSIKSVI